ncbi:MAG: hypothetical protein ACREM2_02680 [Vulcanimicrobiaceae bacterium]
MTTHGVAFYESLATWSQVVAFVVFFAALIAIWVRYINPAVRKAQAQKNAALAEAEHRRDAAKADVEGSQAELARAEEEARAIRERAHGDAARVRGRILARARAEAERIVRNADGELARERSEGEALLRAELLARALELSRDGAARVGRHSLGRLVDAALSALGSEAAA